MRKVCCRLELDSFLKRYDAVYLLGSYNQEAEEGENKWGFATQAVDGMADRLLQAAASSRSLTDGRFLRRLEKTDRNPFAGGVMVGRAVNNDVVIRHPSISKLHAHFQARGGDPTADNLILADVGSSNGTRLNGTVLGLDEPAKAKVGDTCTFGQVDCEIHDGASLHRRVRLLFPTRELLTSGR